MSSDLALRKKRTTAEDSLKADAEVDHRKKRRNRTTQSCLNCHTSKRMCDRKRPACARCTQLGLTGLCVYEVDDPNQRTDTQDESGRLLKRVAELEGVIRELKNKPHPRWSQSAPTTLEAEVPVFGQSQYFNDSTNSLKARRRKVSPEGGSTSRGSFQPPHIDTRPSGSPSSQSSSSYFSPSPLNTPSPTPTQEYSRPYIADAPPDGLQDLDLSSMFLSYPGNQMALQQPFHTHSSHCGCLNETSSYGALLELSVRLRKAADALAKSPRHRNGTNCSLQEKVNELDSFTSISLGNIASPLDSHSGSHHPDVFSLLGRQSTHPMTITPMALNNLDSWDGYISDASLMNDTMMNWEPSR